MAFGIEARNEGVVIRESDTWEARLHVFGRNALRYELVQGRRDASGEEVSAEAIKGDEDGCRCEGRCAIGEERQMCRARASSDFIGPEGESCKECCC